MRRGLIIAALIALPMGAQAQTALGNIAGCERVAGQMESSDNVFVLWPDRIERWESRCKITDIAGDLNTRAVLETSCSGEGETWTQAYGMTPVGEDEIAIWPVESPDFIFQLRRCG